MKKQLSRIRQCSYPLIPIVFIVLCSHGLFAQNIYDPYQDFEGQQNAYGFPGADYPYDGEYQLFLRDVVNHWGNDYLNGQVSYKIETVSFPFMPSFTRTNETLDETDRILVVPFQNSYTEEETSWMLEDYCDDPILIQNVFEECNESLARSESDPLACGQCINKKSATLISNLFKTGNPNLVCGNLAFRKFYPHTIF